MHLNLPIIEQVSGCKNLLIAGMGGGFDVFCGLPLYFELRERGMNVHLANYSFVNLWSVPDDAIRLTDTLVSVQANTPGRHTYFPERSLCRWFRDARGIDMTIWCFQKTGTRTLIENYHALIEHLGVDGILLVDGGVDSVLRGDEAEIGTLLEDAISLIAVSELKRVPLRLLSCVGLGAERDIHYADVFESFAALTQLGAFYGSCSLTTAMPAYQDYEAALLFVQSRPAQDPSVINSSVISATRGNFGDFHLTSKTHGSSLWISPLMPVYWFFDLPAVARRNLLFSELRWTDTIEEAATNLFRARLQRSKRKPGKMPLP